MAKYITPTLTITSNTYTATTNPGPTSSPLNLSVTDLVDATEVLAKIVDASEGLSTTADIYIGHGSSGALEGDTATRLMTLKPGEFAFFGWDMQTDIIIDSSAAVTDACEAILFVRTGTE